MADAEAVVSGQRGPGKHHSDYCNLTCFPLCPFCDKCCGGVMLGRGMALLSVALLLSGCMTAKVGTDYAAVSQKVGPPKAGQSQVAVINKSAMGIHGDSRPDDVYVERFSPKGRCWSAPTALPIDRQVRLKSRDRSGVSRRNSAVSRRAAAPCLSRQSSALRDAISGVIARRMTGRRRRAAVATSGSANLRPRDFVPLDEPTARPMLAELQWQIRPSASRENGACPRHGAAPRPCATTSRHVAFAAAMRISVPEPGGARGAITPCCERNYSRNVHFNARPMQRGRRQGGIPCG